MIQQHKVLDISTGDFLIACKDGASEGPLDATKDWLRNVEALIVLVVHCVGLHASD